MSEYEKLKLEKSLRLQKEMHRRDPLLWLVESLGEDPAYFRWMLHPGYENHKWDGDVDPLYNAWMALAQGEWVGIESATGTGKTFFLSRVVLWFLDCFEDSLVVTSAPKRDQLDLNLWAEITKAYTKFQKIRPKSELLKLKLRVDNSTPDSDDDEKNYGQSWQAIGFVAGVGNEEESATKAQGFHRKDMLIICEEAPGIPSAIYTAFQNTCTGSHNIILAVGNPDNQLDPLHKFCEQDNVRNFRISAYDYPNVVRNEEIYPGAVSVKSIERRTAVYGKGSKMYNSRIRGLSPGSASDTLIKREWIESCCLFKKAYNDLDPIPNDPQSYNAAGVDVANSEEGDKASITWGQGNRLIEIHEFHCSNTNDLAYNMIYTDMELASKGKKSYGTKTLSEYGITPERVGVDAVGVGAGTVNTFHSEHYAVTSLHGGQWKEAIPVNVKSNGETELLYEFTSLRSQMYFTFREECRNREFIITVSDQVILDQLIREATTPKLNITGTKISVESKKDFVKRLGHSPNILDSAVYWNWMRKNRRNEITHILPFGS